MKEFWKTVFWLLMVLIIWYFFILILKAYFSKPINGEKGLYNYKNQTLNNEFDDFLKTNTLSFDEKEEFCADLQYNSSVLWYDSEKIYDWCLYSFLSWWSEPYDENLCIAMKWSVYHQIPVAWSDKNIIVTYKDKCYSDISVYKWNIEYCKNQWKGCLIESVDLLMDKINNINCDVLDENNKKVCEIYKFNSKYSSLMLYNLEKELSDKEIINEIRKVAEEQFKQFWSVENLCNSFSHEVSKVYPNMNLWENKLYNRCIDLYMESYNMYNIDTCKKLKYSVVEKTGDLIITEKDYCISENIIEKTKNIKDCQYADNNSVCVWIVAYLMGDDSNCENLSSSVNKQLCYKASWKIIPTSVTLPRRDCRIKWNISFNSWEKIYHLPWCENYNDTVINTTYWERRFCTENEAIAAWRRKARNCY